ncbi:MAG: antitoxin TumA, partial [Cyanobacteria bacterium J06555_13]
YTSPVDALIALVKQLNVYEAEYRMESAEFFTKYSQGEIGDDEVFVEWSGNYQHFLAIRQELETKLQHVA